MTRLPSVDAFLPSGGIDKTMMPSATHYTNGSSPSILSPLPSSKSTSVAPTATNPRYSSLPPHIVPADSCPPISNASPSATAFATASAPLPPPPSLSPLPFFPHTNSLSSDPTVPRRLPCSHFLEQSAALPPGLDTAATLSRSASADGATPQASSSQLVQRLAQQNALIREAWEAERNYLEANRRRAEEVYQEERAIMEDVRDAWNNEKADMLREMQTLKERIQRLEGENSALKVITTQTIQLNGGVISPLASQRGDSVDGSSDSPSYFTVVPGSVAIPQPHNKPPRMFSPISCGDPSEDLPPGLDGASRRPHFASPKSSQTCPLRMPDSSPPIHPRTQPEMSAPRDFLASPEEDAETPVPVIDVQEIDPKLEGISLKATAVQKSTFEAPQKSHPVTSPPVKTDVRHSKTLRSVFGKRPFAKDQAMHILATEESRRLTMHAGHTPNHSLSLFPTMTTVTETSTAMGRSEGTTPTAIASAPPERHEETGLRGSAIKHRYRAREAINGHHSEFSHDDEAEEPEQPLLEPADDIPLKGPLMVKNIPAQDELFWAALNKKLEPISQGQGALPTVMQTPIAELDASPLQAIAVGGDATNDDPDSKNMEPDIPLKFKTTTNFGAPFGRF